MAANVTTTTTADRRHFGFGGALLAGIRQRIAVWDEQSRIRTELRAMSERELADLGLRTSDIDDVARGTFRRP